ncbi:MAG TPA: GNAT family N-acetyltransferase [Elusimicrobiales bacterium]|nr:GNAT family N-acetyltransferase [Elusimicrobiales bacterium]
MKEDKDIVFFDPAAAPEELWTVHYDHLDAISRELDPDEPLVPRAKRREMLLASLELRYTNKYTWFLMEGGAAAGYLWLSVENPKSPTYGTNKASAQMKLSVAPGNRRRGLGKRLLAFAAAELAAREPQVKEVLSPVMTGEGKLFIEAAGGALSLEQAENRLYLSEVDWAAVERWAEEGKLRNPGTSVLAVTSIPEEDIEEYARIYSETMNQQPLGDINLTIAVTPAQIRLGERKQEELGATHLTMYCKDPDGSVAGLTETHYMPESGHCVRQFLTGVREPCRGRGLGKLLKALMLLHIRKNWPGVKYVATSNAGSNAPMMAINTALGFKKRRPVLIYKLRLDGVRAGEGSAGIPPASRPVRGG